MFATLNDVRDAITCFEHDAPTDTHTHAALAKAHTRDANLTKPKGSLGQLEELVSWYVRWTGKTQLDSPQAVVFAGNHGVAQQGVSAFPVEVTAQMVENFKAGGAAINQLCALNNVPLQVHSLSLDKPTQDFTQAPAMTEPELLDAVVTGWSSVHEDTDLLITGEMGIGNTTSATAIYCGVWGWSAQDVTGIGTGITPTIQQRKTDIIQQGLDRHKGVSPLEVLRCLGGREIAAMFGAILCARHKNIPVILDGFICCAAASVLHAINPNALSHCMAGHASAEGAHTRVLNALGKRPMLHLDMRLGEGTGAAMAISLLKGALACHNGMATFDQAGVSASQG